MRSPLWFFVVLVAALLARLGPAQSVKAPAAAQNAGPDGQTLVRIHRDHVLGTSLDLAVRADAKMAEAFLQAVLKEVERLDAVFSHWRQDTPVAALLRGETLVAAPVELIQLLQRAESLRLQTRGAFDVRIGGVVQLWREAVANGKPPASETLEAALRSMRGSSFTVDVASGSIAPMGTLHLLLDGIGKGAILDAALAGARTACPEVTAALLDLGGDQRAFGAPRDGEPWQLGIADPQQPQDNQRVLVRVALGERAAATSGGYARGFQVDGRHHSHILDPGFGQPATGALQATVLAPDAALADALATAFCVLSPSESLEVAVTFAAVDCLVIDRAGKRHVTRGFQALLDSAVVETAATGASAFPKAQQLEIALELPKIEARRYERPYTAVWVENARGEHVATLAVWGRNRRWVSELTNWWKADPTARDRVDAIGRASRGPGAYRLLWGGLDDQGAAVPAGDYTVVIEVSREHGGHTVARATIRCGDDEQAASMAGNRELVRASLRYGVRREDG